MDSEVDRVVDHLFRREAGRMVATLARTLGFDQLALAEDSIQEALLRAVRQWPFGGIPQHPAAWLMRVARNHALDHVRREQNFRRKEEVIALFLEQRSRDRPQHETFADEIGDDQLRLIFACCHPTLAVDAQIALTLKTLCGLGEGEIAGAFLTTRAAIAKRLVRARQQIREKRIALDIPAGPDLEKRLGAVRAVLYLLFNEGYKASQGAELLRADLSSEAIRLTRLLVSHPVANQPQSHALLALMLCNAARFPARADAEGNLLLLAEQDRTLWDRALIEEGIRHLRKSARGNGLSEFHLQAGIAAEHCLAASYSETDWPRILFLYDALLERSGSPIISLHRAIALANVAGAPAGLAAIEEMPDRRSLENYYLYHAILGRFQSSLGEDARALEHFRRAAELTQVHSERAFLEKRVAESEAKLAPTENRP